MEGGSKGPPFLFAAVSIRPHAEVRRPIGRSLEASPATLPLHHVEHPPRASRLRPPACAPQHEALLSLRSARPFRKISQPLPRSRSRYSPLNGMIFREVGHDLAFEVDPMKVRYVLGCPKVECDGRTARSGVIEPEFALGRGDDADTTATQSDSSTEIPGEYRVSVCVALRLADPNRAVLRAKPFPVTGT